MQINDRHGQKGLYFRNSSQGRPDLMKPAVAWTIAAIGMAAACSHALAQNALKEGEKVLLEGAKSQITPSVPGAATTGAIPGAAGAATSVPGAQGVTTSLPGTPGATTMVPGVKDVTGKVSGVPGTAAAVPGTATTVPGAGKAAGTSVAIPGVPGGSVTTPALPGAPANAVPVLTTTPSTTAPSR